MGLIERLATKLTDKMADKASEDMSTSQTWLAVAGIALLMAFLSKYKSPNQDEVENVMLSELSDDEITSELERRTKLK
jgi:hypothetical protein